MKDFKPILTQGAFLSHFHVHCILCITPFYVCVYRQTVNVNCGMNESVEKTLNIVVQSSPIRTPYKCGAE